MGASKTILETPMTSKIHYFNMCPSRCFWKSTTPMSSIDITIDVKYVTCQTCKKMILEHVLNVDWEKLNIDELNIISSWANSKK